MKKLVMTGPKKSEVIEVDIPKINSNQILVKLKYTGMCHSEWYPWSTAKPGQTFGHEPMGVVAEVGGNVRDFKPGDRVTGLGGGYAQYIVMDQGSCLHVPDNIADEDAVVEPLVCLLSAASRMPIVTAGDTAAVVGAGYMGLGMISLFKLKGAGKIVAVDTRKEALEHALQFGATEAYTPDTLPAEYLLNWENWGKTDMFRTGLPTVVEFTGTESGLRLAGDMVCAHGSLGIGGYHNDRERTIDFKLWNVKAIDANSLHERRGDYSMYCARNALSLLSGGTWNFTGLARNIYTLEEFDKANEEMENKPKGYIKALVRCSD